jgi:undecaprenyl-diphosphatase
MATNDQPRPSWLMRASAGCFGLFLVVAVAVATGWPPLARLDLRWSSNAYSFTQTHGWCESLARLATWFGNVGTVTAFTAVGVVACLVRRQVRLGWWLALTVAGGAVVNTLVKNLLQRVRPAGAGVLTSAHGFAFPSGHTQTATVTYTALVLVVGWRLSGRLRQARRTTVVAVVVLVVAVGLSRVFLGAHWPSDVLGGWLLGGAWVSAATATLVRLSAGAPAQPPSQSADPAVRRPWRRR